MDYLLLKNLIELLEEYHQESQSSNINDFIIWTNNKLFTNDNYGDESHDTLSIAFMIMHLNKELKKQTKVVLSNSRIFSIDEYSFLFHLNYQESFRKMEIIELHNLEAPTGIEIIKRLLKNELIEEFPDEKDKRAVRIQITELGKQEIQQLEPQISKIFFRFTEDLELNEKIKMAGLLNKMV